MDAELFAMVKKKRKPDRVIVKISVKIGISVKQVGKRKHLTLRRWDKTSIPGPRLELHNQANLQDLVLILCQLLKL